MPEDAPTVLILMGVSGSGKTTVGRRLAEDLGWPFYEGDDFHPQRNVEKMSRGDPLNDEDRKPWLEKIRDQAAQTLGENRSAVIACSALKKKYRRTIRGESGGRVQFVYLEGAFDLIEERLEARTDHYMPPGLLESQFEALQEPEPREDVLEVSIEQPPEAIIEEIRDELAL